MKPSRIIPAAGQCAENSVGVLSNPRDVFQEDEGRLNLIDKSHDVEEKTASLAVQACATARKAEVLAREAAIDDVNGGG